MLGRLACGATGSRRAAAVFIASLSTFVLTLLAAPVLVGASSAPSASAAPSATPALISAPTLTATPIAVQAHDDRPIT